MAASSEHTASSRTIVSDAISYLNHLVHFAFVAEVRRQAGRHVTFGDLEALKERRVVTEAGQVFGESASTTTTGKTSSSKRTIHTGYTRMNEGGEKRKSNNFAFVHLAQERTTRGLNFMDRPSYCLLPVKDYNRPHR